MIGLLCDQLMFLVRHALIRRPLENLRLTPGRDMLSRPLQGHFPSFPFFN